MDAHRLLFFKDLLLNKRRVIIETIEKLRESSNMQDEMETASRTFSSSNSDEGGDYMDREQIFLFISREFKYLHQIDNALLLIERGKYGICQECGTAISEERLEAVPTTQICVNCKSRQSSRIKTN